MGHVAMPRVIEAPAEPRVVRTGFLGEQPYRLRQLISHSEVCAQVLNLANEIRHEYGREMDDGEELVVVPVHRGAYLFSALLSMNIDPLPHRIAPAELSSYEREESTGRISVAMLPEEKEIRGKRVLIVEDIVDTGLSMDHLLSTLSNMEPKSLRLCTLLDKPSRRRDDLDVAPDYAGYCIPDLFVVGFGLDYEQSLRHLGGVWHLELVYRCDDCGAEGVDLTPDGDTTFYCSHCFTARAKGHR